MDPEVPSGDICGEIKGIKDELLVPGDRGGGRVHSDDARPEHSRGDTDNAVKGRDVTVERVVWEVLSPQNPDTGSIILLIGGGEG